MSTRTAEDMSPDEVKAGAILCGAISYASADARAAWRSALREIQAIRLDPTTTEQKP